MATSVPAFPGYRVLNTLGQGGMGQVFLAEDEVLGRRVAIKTILPAVSGEGEHRARFLREARAMATVEHSRVVRVYSFGEAGGQAYFVMEWIEGETLAARLLRTPQLPVAEALRIARESAEALAAAWARGLVHRDVKPSNIILDRDGHVHVADFGLARPAHADGDPSITREGGFVGSPHYVAPEQVRAQEPDFRTDVYSLGIVLYEMLAGRRPFEGRTAMEVITRQLSDPLPSLRSFAPAAPEPVLQLVDAMTQKEPAARPDSYPTLIAGLSGTAPGVEPGFTPASTLPTMSRPMPLLPMPAMVTGAARSRWLKPGLALVLVVALPAAMLWRERRVRTPRPPGEIVVALAPLAAADGESEPEARTLSTLVESETRRLLGDEEGRSVGLALPTSPARGVREARQLGEQAAADYVLWGEVLSFRGDVEVQPALTRVGAEGSASPRLASLQFEAQADSPIEVRRRAALRLAEAVARLGSRAALDRGQAETALVLLQECRPTTETLELKATVLDRLGRKDEAERARQEATAVR